MLHIQILLSWQIIVSLENYSYLQKLQQPHQDPLQSESLPVTTNSQQSDSYITQLVEYLSICEAASLCDVFDNCLMNPKLIVEKRVISQVKVCKT